MLTPDFSETLPSVERKSSFAACSYLKGIYLATSELFDAVGDQ